MTLFKGFLKGFFLGTLIILAAVFVVAAAVAHESGVAPSFTCYNNFDGMTTNDRECDCDAKALKRECSAKLRESGGVIFDAPLKVERELKHCNGHFPLPNSPQDAWQRVLREIVGGGGPAECPAFNTVEKVEGWLAQAATCRLLAQRDDTTNEDRDRCDNFEIAHPGFIDYSACLNAVDAREGAIAEAMQSESHGHLFDVQFGLFENGYDPDSVECRQHVVCATPNDNQLAPHCPRESLKGLCSDACARSPQICQRPSAFCHEWEEW